jgi:acyl-CoA dehydrogenase
MDYAYSERSLELQEQVSDFMRRFVYPAEKIFEQQANANRAAGPTFRTPSVIQDLKAEAKSRNLWNLFLPDERYGPGLSVIDYAPIAEILGRSPNIAPEAMNCAAPDTGNMELIAMFGTDEQREQSRPLTRQTCRRPFFEKVTTTSSTAASGGRPALCAMSARSRSLWG